MDQNWSPFTFTVGVLIETFTWDRKEVSIFIVAERDPFFWESAVVLGIIEGLKWKPVRWVFGWVAVIDSLLKIVSYSHRKIQIKS